MDTSLRIRARISNVREEKMNTMDDHRRELVLQRGLETC
jgi:hypothetical protein